MSMTNSILLTVKKLLGISEEYHAFDIDILTDINAVFLTLNQLGVGPRLPFQLPLLVDYEDAEDPALSTTWDDFLGDQKEYLAAVQTYVYQRVRLIFDPPTNSFMVSAIQESCKEFEWRFTVQPKTEGAVENVESYATHYKTKDEEDSENIDIDWDLRPPTPTEPEEPGEDNEDEPGDTDGDGEDQEKDLFDIFG